MDELKPNAHDKTKPASQSEREGAAGARSETPDVSHIQNPAVAHEHSDVSVSGILTFAVGLIVTAVVIYLSLWTMFARLTRHESSLQSAPSPLAGEFLKLPPEPRLQGAPGHEVHPMVEMQALRASEDAVLNNYGWIDQGAGKVRIPIDQAMRRLVEQGLPTRPPSDENALDPPRLETPTRASVGRTREIQK